MNHWLRYAFFAMVIRPVMIVVLGTNVRRAQWLPESGPAVIVANHNSHLDVFALMNVLGLGRLRQTRPVAAADYFLTRPLRSWFARRIVGIIPIDRTKIRREAGKHPLDPISDALNDGCIVLLFPEGTRGQPEEMAAFQSGVAHLAKRHPEVPITPVFMHGLGKALPKGEALLVPFFCDLFVGKPINEQPNSEQANNESIDRPIGKRELMEKLNESMSRLANEMPIEVWAD